MSSNKKPARTPVTIRAARVTALATIMAALVMGLFTLISIRLPTPPVREAAGPADTTASTGSSINLENRSGTQSFEDSTITVIQNSPNATIHTNPAQQTELSNQEPNTEPPLHLDRNSAFIHYCGIAQSTINANVYVDAHFEGLFLLAPGMRDDFDLEVLAGLSIGAKRTDDPNANASSDDPVNALTISLLATTFEARPDMFEQRPSDFIEQASVYLNTRTGSSVSLFKLHEGREDDFIAFIDSMVGDRDRQLGKNDRRKMYFYEHDLIVIVPHVSVAIIADVSESTFSRLMQTQAFPKDLRDDGFGHGVSDGAFEFRFRVPSDAMPLGRTHEGIISGMKDHWKTMGVSPELLGGFLGMFGGIYVSFILDSFGSDRLLMTLHARFRDEDAAIASFEMLSASGTEGLEDVVGEGEITSIRREGRDIYAQFVAPRAD